MSASPSLTDTLPSAQIVAAGQVVSEAPLGAIDAGVPPVRTLRPAVEIYSDSETLMHAAADRIARHARRALGARGRFSIALSGGTTPRRLYELLARPPFGTRIDWSRVDVFWGDERCVPRDHPESNYRMACEALLDRVPIPPENVHRIAGEDEPQQAARAYEQTLRSYFKTAEGPPKRSFDLVLLGMGDDGHTASLFPGTPAVTELQRWVMPTIGPHGMWRITLTPVVIDAATAITFLVAGAAKADRLKEALEREQANLPVQFIRPTHGAVTWMVDAPAASRVRRTR